jgi:60 kDa SS-A/Ro ribonucleoprotein
MANKSLFGSTFGAHVPKTDAVNEAGGAAYTRTPEQALAQYAATGCMNHTFYASAREQLTKVMELAGQVEPEFLAKVALHSRGRGHMKDVPALLVAMLSVRSPGLMAEVFDRVIDSPKMLRNFVQVMRSGVVGRKSLGTLPKRLVLQWLEARTDEQIFRASVGNSPSMADVLKMVHPKPATASRAALYGYLVGKPHDAAALPELVKRYEAFKAKPSMFTAEELPAVPMDMLTSLPLEPEHWKALARSASWQTLRMNLNTFTRHGVFVDGELVAAAASRLRDPVEIARSRVFPYQLMAAFMNVVGGVHGELKNALKDAMEVAISNVPEVSGKVWVFPDVSGSMQSPVTGHREGATSAMRCVDVAALVAAAVLRKNPGAGVVPFSDDVVLTEWLNPRDSVMTNAQRLASLPSGGTNCAAPLAHLNRLRAEGDLVVYVSDNQSWIEAAGLGSHTETVTQWQTFKRRNPRARMVCIDLQPYSTVQAPDRTDILNVGGFSDSVFSIVAEFNKGSLSSDHWVRVIEKEVI